MTQTKNEGFVSHHLKILWWSEQLNSLFQLPYAIWWQWTGVGAYWNLTPTVDLLYMMRYWSGSVNSDALVQSKMWYALLLAVFSCFSEGGIFTVKGGGGIFTEIIFTVNMPPLKNSPIKTGKSMLFFYIWNATFSVMLINSQIYMTTPKQAPNKLSENIGKTFSVIMPPFSSRGGA